MMMSKLLLLCLLVFAAFSIQMDEEHEEALADHEESLMHEDTFIVSPRMRAVVNIPFSSWKNSQTVNSKYGFVTRIRFRHLYPSYLLNRMYVRAWISCKGGCYSTPSAPAVLEITQRDFKVMIPFAKEHNGGAKNWLLNYEVVTE